MREPSRAPAYAAIYHGLAAIAREHGYALAIHGTLARDLDLIAVPWVTDADDAQTLVEALRKHCHACLSCGDDTGEGAAKPHGRIAWNLYMLGGFQVDLSVMPLAREG